MASSCVTCTSSQSSAGGCAPARTRVDDVERREIDDPGLRTRRLARRLVFAHDIFARHDNDELRGAAGRPQAGHVADLRILDAEGRCLADLPSNQLVEVGPALGHLLEPQQGYFGDAIGNGQRHPFRARAYSLEHHAQRGRDGVRIDDVGRVQRRNDRIRGQQLDGVRGDREPGVAKRDRCGRHPMAGDFDRDCGRCR